MLTEKLTLNLLQIQTGAFILNPRSNSENESFYLHLNMNNEQQI